MSRTVRPGAGQVDAQLTARNVTVVAAVCAVAIAIGVLLLALVAGGGRPAVRLPGLPDPGPVVGWGLPILRTLADLALMAAVGTALLAVLLPLRRGRLSAEARRTLRITALAAGSTAALFATTALLGFADEVGDLPRALSPAELRGQLPHDAGALDLLVTAALMLAGSVAARWAAATGGRDSSAWPMLIAFAAILPIALTGHAAAGSRHLLALAALAVHLLAVCTWVGGLAALTVYAHLGGRALGPVLPRFSALAAACYFGVGLSGVLLAVTRLATPAQLVSSDYGRIMLAKTLAWAVLGLLAIGHRRRTLPTVAAALPNGALEGRAARRLFTRLATAEVLLMAATVGLAVALSRTPPPA